MNLISLILLASVGFLVADSAKLNYPRVLLPIFEQISVNFTLEVIEKGCFKWTSSRQDLIQITPLDDGSDGECSYRAMVTVITREKRRNTAIVLAEELSTGDMLRCDVILDLIDKLEVLTTTRELFLEEVPEIFEIFARDSQGNSFTTLEGVELNWAISSQNYQKADSKKDSTWQQVLRFVKFSDSVYYEIPKALERFESLGLRGYMVLLEGINTGTARVTVGLSYPEYASIIGIQVDIVVLASIILDPTEVHILVGDTVNFRILQMKQGKQQEISLNNQYYLEVKDRHLVSISGSSATGKNIGRTSVVLRDRNVPNERSISAEDDSFQSPMPMAILTVATADKIIINLLPYYNWITVEGEKHEIAIDLYTKDGQKILLGSQYVLNSQFDESIFYVLKKTANGSRIYGEAVREGRSFVHGSFETLTAKAELIVYKELILTPTKVILPYGLANQGRQKIKFTATGGDGSYVWSTQNPHLVHISQTGIAEIQIEPETEHELELIAGRFDVLAKHTSVKVALARNVKIFRAAEIFFLPPIKLEIIKYNFETSLKDFVRIHVGVFTYTNGSYMPFTNCDNMHFTIEFSNQIFQLDSKKEQTSTEQLELNACRLLYLRATSIGMTNIRISYKFMDKLLKDEAQLVVFEKLQILNPTENEVILPIGSSANVIYAHGPQKIFNIEAELTKSVSYDKTIADVHEIVPETSKAIHVIRVLCHKVGNTVLSFDIFNALLRENYEPYVSSYRTQVHCVKPRFINLYATEKLRESCPMEVRSSIVHRADDDHNIQVEIEVLDAYNRKLMNITSLVIDWQFQQANGHLYSGIAHIRESRTEIIESVPVSGRDVLVTSISNVPENFKIKGRVTNYDMKVLNSYTIKPEEPHFGIKKIPKGALVQPIIENELRFMAVTSTMFPSDDISIFLARNKPERISISQGSGHYTFELSDQDIISVDFDTKTRQLIITPHQIGNVVISLIDRCLMSEPARLHVSVVVIGSIKVQALDRVEKSKHIEAIVKLYDSNDNLLNIDHSSLVAYELHEEIFNKEILNVQLAHQENLFLGEIRYFVYGLELGETKVVFSSGHNDLEISSDALNIQVFPPLRIYPRNSTLVVGSSVQIYAQGGPLPDVNIVYSVINQNIVSMDSAFVFAKKLGHTKITGKCLGINPRNGETIVFSEDTVDVHVVPLEGIKIKTPFVRMRLGAIMPAFVWGVPDLSPMILGTLDMLRVVWSTNSPDIIQVYGIFSEIGVEYSDRDSISVRIKALNSGEVRLQATVILPGGHKLTTHMEIVVFKVLELDYPKVIKMDAILMAPQSMVQLKANLDDAVYRLSKDAAGIIHVTSSGLVKSRNVLGQDSIIASSLDQTLPIDIEVKNVQYIMASLQYPCQKMKHIEEKIPRGMHLPLKVSLYDNLGNEFSHTINYDSIKYELSYKDAIDMQIGSNLQISITVPREATTMIAISLKDNSEVKHAEDFVRISVAESRSIFPTKTIFAVGDIICFETPLSAVSSWISSDERLVTIEKSTGVGIIINNRIKQGEKVTITNGERMSNFVKFELEIREADKVEFIKSHDVLSGDIYRRHLLIRNHLQVDKFSNLIAKNISRCLNFVDKVPVKYFTCRLSSKHPLGRQILDNYRTSPIFDKYQPSYACEVELITSQLEVIKIVKNNEIHVELEAQLPNGVSDTVTLKIVPAINVTPEALSVDQIGDQGIFISGLEKVLQKVEVKSSDTSILEIVPQAKTLGSLEYKVKLLNELPTDEQLFVQVFSPLTLQNIELPIQGPNPVLRRTYQQNTSMYILTLASSIGFIVSLLFIGCVTIVVWLYCFPQFGRRKVEHPFLAAGTPPQDISKISNLSGGQHFSTHSSPYFGPNISQGSSVLSAGNESPVYGDSTLASPQRRINRMKHL